MVLQALTPRKAGAQRVQPKSRPPRVKVVLSAEARATLKLDRREKSQRFKKDLDHAWKSLDDATKTITSKHHKSVRHVQNELFLGHTKFRSRRNKINPWNAYFWKQRCIDRAANESDENSMFFVFVLSSNCLLKNIAAVGGKPTLRELVQQIREEYLKLLVEEKEHAVEEFSEFRECKTKGIRVTVKSKISDITYTVNTIENEVCVVSYFACPISLFF